MQALLPKIFNGSHISQFQALSWSERVKLWRVQRKIDLRLWQWGGLDSSSSSLGFFFLIPRVPSSRPYELRS